MRKTAFLELAEKRRSVRAYKPDEVPDELVQTVLEAGRLAPSACNKQPWRFIVVRSETAGARWARPMPANGSGKRRS
jgi:nitroreductase